MANPILVPIRFLGWTVAGLGLAVGWKLGSYLVDVALGEEQIRLPFSKPEGTTAEKASETSRREPPEASARDFQI